MKRSVTVALIFLCVVLVLAACGSGTPPASPPAPEAVSLVTDPGQATTEAPTPAPIFTPTPSPEPTATSTPQPSPTPEPTPTPEPVPVVQVPKAGANSINVREGPGTDYPIVAELAPGQEAPVMGRNEAGTWWQIALAEAGTSGWIFGELVDFTGDAGEIAVAAAPPSPTPDPAAVATAPETAETTPPAAEENYDNNEEDRPLTPEELEEQLRCGKDFCVTYQAMVPIWENGGCIGNHSIYVTVLEGPPPGRPMDGVVIGDTFGNIEVASGDKGPGTAEITLWMNSMSVVAKRHIDGKPYTSEESFSFTSHDELIPAEVLAANGYCDGSVEKCRVAQQSNQVCRGHYSWRVTFHKFD